MALDELARRKERQQAKRVEQEQGLRERAALLRDFERTTLTAANFSALKGMTVEVLETTLAQARVEATQAPARPEHHRPRPDHRRPERAGQGQGQGRDRKPRAQAGDKP